MRKANSESYYNGPDKDYFASRCSYNPVAPKVDRLAAIEEKLDILIALLTPKTGE